MTDSPSAVQSRATPTAAVYAGGFDASSRLSSSMTIGAFAPGRCQPSAACVQPAALSAVLAASDVVGDGRVGGRIEQRRRGRDRPGRLGGRHRERVGDDPTSVDGRQQRRPDGRLRELGMTRSQVEQDGRQGRTRIAQHAAPVGRPELLGHRRRETRCRIEAARPIGIRERLRVVEEPELDAGQVRHRTRRPAERRGGRQRVGGSWRGPGARGAVEVQGGCRDELGRVVGQAGDGERTGPDRLATERVIRQVGDRDAGQQVGRRRSAGSRPGGTRRAAS